MTRVFLGLAISSLVLLCFNLYLGLTGGDYNGVSAEYRVAQAAWAAARNSIDATPASVDDSQAKLRKVTDQLRLVQERARLHGLCGVLAALVTVLVNSLCVTYFIGTGRWCREVAETYELASTFDNRAAALKRRTFPWSILGIVTVLTISALGAAADPGTLRDSTSDWVRPHLVVACGGTIVIAVACWFQFLGIEQNYRLISDIMQEVRNVRSARGLAIEPDTVPAEPS